MNRGTPRIAKAKGGKSFGEINQAGRKTIIRKKKKQLRVRNARHTCTGEALGAAKKKQNKKKQTEN